ncbi:unnamed protein product [Cylicocyclus nassatus]|uniref:Uncharacterized protein n=1 Tax=Cylicocyclus nassatus TaxID=53992 RepID=A0AA36MD99_CYLNA|nr:unnamed protein product [Cylicocyclus nassatus]
MLPGILSQLIYFPVYRIILLQVGAGHLLSCLPKAENVGALWLPLGTRARQTDIGKSNRRLVMKTHDNTQDTWFMRLLLALASSSRWTEES